MADEAASYPAAARFCLGSARAYRCRPSARRCRSRRFGRPIIADIPSTGAEVLRTLRDARATTILGRVCAVPSEESNPNKVYARHDDTDWVINCFVTRMDYRKQGVATCALDAAITAIKRHGGGWVEVVTMAFPHHDPRLAELRRTYRWRSPEVAEYVRESWPTMEIPGVGTVQGCPTSPRTMGHTGTMSMFEEAGFTATQKDQERSPDAYHPGDFVVMRRHV